MLTPWRFLPRAVLIRQQCRSISDARPFRTGDIVLLREKTSRCAPPILTRPLTPGKQIQSHRGVLNHDDLIGKRVRDVVTTVPSRSGKPGTEYRLHEVKLEEYVRLSKRLVTPVYPADAGLIVELLDLHPSEHREAEDSPKLEILEAGTGHGALTLYLSRAIHGANPPLPSSTEDYDMEEWKRSRKAVIHTIDISSKYSAHAQKVIRGFRRGLYYYNIDFHVTDIGSFVRQSLAQRSGRAFLSHAILDLPNADSHLADVAAALRTDGTLVVFNPSITQITQCASKIKEEEIPLDLDKVVELPVNGGAAGREWDVRFVKPRAGRKAAVEAEGEVEGGDEVSENNEDSAEEHDVDEGREEAPTATATTEKEGWSMVCRPRVGERIVGGGFLGVWRKKRDMLLTQDEV